ncbi:hypothetical protein N7B46_RS23045, partial [Escherichia coli]
NAGDIKNEPNGFFGPYLGLGCRILVIRSMPSHVLATYLMIQKAIFSSFLLRLLMHLPSTS